MRSLPDSHHASIVLFMLLACTAAAFAQGGTLGPWRIGDIAFSRTLADDRPNAESHAIVSADYVPLVPERIIPGEAGTLRFRVAPRAEGWAGILVLDADGKPVKLDRAKKYKVVFTDADGKPVDRARWDQREIGRASCRERVYCEV